MDELDMNIKETVLKIGFGIEKIVNSVDDETLKRIMPTIREIEDNIILIIDTFEEVSERGKNVSEYIKNC